MNFEDNKRIAALLFLAVLCGFAGCHRFQRRGMRHAAENAAMEAGYLVSP